MIGYGGKTALVLVTFLFGCGTTTTISDDPIAEDDPSPPNRRNLPDGGKVVSPTPGTPAPEPASEGGMRSIECLGQKLDAWACEGFEGMDSPLPPFVVAAEKGSVGRATNRALGGAASLRTTFDPLPATGKAQVVFEKPNSTPSGMSLQVSVYVEDDAHDLGDDIVLATLSGGTTRVRLHFVPTALGNVLEVRTKTAANATTYTLGQAPKNGWACIEMELDAEGDLQVWRGKDAKVNVRLGDASPVSRAEVGIEWTHGANANASKQFWFDDVIVGPHSVGCLH